MQGVATRMAGRRESRVYFEANCRHRTSAIVSISRVVEPMEDFSYKSKSMRLPGLSTRQAVLSSGSSDAKPDEV